MRSVTPRTEPSSRAPRRLPGVAGVAAVALVVLGGVAAAVALAGAADAATLAPSVTTLTSSPNPSTTGQGVTLVARVQPVTAGTGSAVGTVTFRDGTTVLGTSSWWFGSYGISIPPLSAGQHALTATFNGSTTLAPSTGNVTQTVVKQASSVQVSTATDPVVTGQAASLAATVTLPATGATAPLASVTFTEGTTTLGTAIWWFGAYRLNLANLTPGDHVITARYAGTASVAPSSASLTQRVRVATALDLATSPAPALTTQPVTAVAVIRPAVSGGAAISGSVTFSEGAIVIATVPVSSGRASVALPALAAGDHRITATYAGDARYAAATTTSTVVVRIDTSLAVTASANPSTAGQPVSFTVAVQPKVSGGPTPTGTVTVLGGLGSSASASLVSGRATVSLASLGSGDHTITATYTGDGTYRAATASTAQVVGAPTGTATATGPLVVTSPPATWQPLTAAAGTPASQYGGDGGNQIVLPSDGNLLWASNDQGGTDTSGADFIVNNVVSISSPSAPLVQRQPLGPTGRPYQLVKPRPVSPCAAGEKQLLWNAGMVALPQAGWDRVLIWFQNNCLGTDGVVRPQAVGLAELDYTPSMAADMVTPWSDHVKVLSYDLYGAAQGVHLPELGPDGNLYLYQCDTGAGLSAPTPQDLLGCKVARVAPNDAATVSRYRYWDGAGWGATTLATGVYMILGDTVTPVRNPAGMFKVSYVPQMGLWVLGSQAWPGFNGTPLFRVARAPQGPWSVPATIPYLGCGGTTNHVCYGSMVSASLSDATHLTVVYEDEQGRDPALSPTGEIVPNPDGTIPPPPLAGQLHVVTALITSPGLDSVPTAPAQVATTTSVSTPTNPSVAGQPVGLQATVAVTPTSPDPSGANVYPTPTGAVTFRDGTTDLGAGVWWFGAFRLTLSALPAGDHVITATYPGDASYLPSSATLTLHVQPATTTLAAASSANPSYAGRGVTISAALGVVAPGGGSPTGVVTFSEGTTALGQAAPYMGTAAITLSTLSVGSHVITVAYAGDGSYLPSSTTITQTVQRAPVTVTVTSSANPAAFGTDIVLSAKLDAGPNQFPTGTVTFRDGAVVLGTGTWWFGSYSLTVRGLAVGTHTITASYSGDASFLPASASLAQAVV